MRSIAKCIVEWVLVDRNQVRERDTRVIFVWSAMISERCCSALTDYDSAAYKIKITRTGDYEMNEWRVYDGREFRAERELISRSVVVRGEADKEEAIWVAKVLLSCRCFVKGDTEDVEPAFVQ